MITFIVFLEILTTSAFIVTGCMLAMITAQIIHSYWYRQMSRKRRLFCHQRRREAEFQKKERLLNKLIEDYKIIRVEKTHLATENDALRRELRLYGEIRADMLSHSISLESENFNLRSELNAANREIRAYEDERSYLISATKADQEEEYFVELDVEPDAVIGAKGVSFEEIAELPLIMQGTSDMPDMEASVIVAKATGTVLFEQFQEQIKDSKWHIGSLIDRIDQKMRNRLNPVESAAIENTFYENTGFSIRDFLPSKSA